MRLHFFNSAVIANSKMDYWPVSKLSESLWLQGGKRKEGLQLRLWNLNPTSNSPVAPRRLSCQISANQHKVETIVNVIKHCKTCAQDNDVITNFISANQHFPSTFSMQIFKFQRCSCKPSFLFSPCHQSAPESLLTGQFRLTSIFLCHIQCINLSGLRSKENSDSNYRLI